MRVVALQPLGSAARKAYVTRMDDAKPKTAPTPPPTEAPAKLAPTTAEPREIGGPKGPEPTRYGDWEHKGRCSDF